MDALPEVYLWILAGLGVLIGISGYVILGYRAGSAYTEE
jgi:hypothetical protein